MYFAEIINHKPYISAHVRFESHSSTHCGRAALDLSLPKPAKVLLEEGKVIELRRKSLQMEHGAIRSTGSHGRFRLSSGKKRVVSRGPATRPGVAWS